MFTPGKRRRSATPVDDVAHVLRSPSKLQRQAAYLHTEIAAPAAGVCGAARTGPAAAEASPHCDATAHDVPPQSPAQHRLRRLLGTKLRIAPAPAGSSRRRSGATSEAEAGPAPPSQPMRCSAEDTPATGAVARAAPVRREPSAPFCSTMVYRRSVWSTERVHERSRWRPISAPASR